jgi:hypothetical protein
MTAEEKIAMIKQVLQRHSSACAKMEAELDKEIGAVPSGPKLMDMISRKNSHRHRLDGAAISEINRILFQVSDSGKAIPANASPVQKGYQDYQREVQRRGQEESSQ